MSAVRVDLDDSGEVETIGESPYGGFVFAWYAHHSRVVLVENG